MIEEIVEHANVIRADCDYFLVIATGGPYNGAKAVIEALSHKRVKNSPEVIFAGDELCAWELEKIKNMISGKRVWINYISKSGTTLEPKLVFEFLSKDVPKNKIIYTTTDGKLKGYKTYKIPKGIGGRYSVFTCAGLLPMAVAGLDVQKFVDGGKNSANLLCKNQLAEGLQKYEVNLFVFFQKRLEAVGAWLCQLFNESCGKERKGIFSSTTIYPRDLHSLGQMVQDGKRNLIETFIKFEDQDECSQFGSLNKIVYSATLKAHTDGGIPVTEVSIEKLDEFHLGALMQFMMDECVKYCTLIEVNPFDQPGVEAYKTEMKKLLGVI